MRWVATHDFLELFLSDFVNPQVKRIEAYFMLWFLATNSSLPIVKQFTLIRTMSGMIAVFGCAGDETVERI